MTNCCESTIVNITDNINKYKITSYNKRFKICCILNFNKALMKLHNYNTDDYHKKCHLILSDCLSNLYIQPYKDTLLHLHKDTQQLRYKIYVNDDNYNLDKKIILSINNIKISESNNIIIKNMTSEVPISNLEKLQEENRLLKSESLEYEDMYNTLLRDSEEEYECLEEEYNKLKLKYENLLSTISSIG